MRFRRVDAQVLDGGSAGVGVDGVPEPLRRFTAHGRNREATLAFAEAWRRKDREHLVRLSTPEISCRWIGFGAEPVTARGIDALLEIGVEFERRHGVAERYTLVEAMGGESHAAIQWQPHPSSTGASHVARVAVYRLDDERVSSIAVYADLGD